MPFKTAVQQQASKSQVRGAQARESRSSSQPPLHSLQHAIGNIATTRLLGSSLIQPKLNVSHPQDESEREADRVADQAMRMPELSPPRATRSDSPPSIQRACDSCEDEVQRKTEYAKNKFDDEEDAGLLQAKFESPVGPSATQKATHINRSCDQCDDELPRKAQTGSHQENFLSAIRGPTLSRKEKTILQRSHAYGPGSVIQLKPVHVSSPADAEEKEADEVSRKVIDGQFAEIRPTPEARSKADASPQLSSDFHQKLENSKGGGQPLPANFQMEMGSRMGADFSAVRIHTGTAAHGMSETIQARAFTQGSDIYFRHGEYDPSSTPGKLLLAHELTHTVQQRQSPQRKIHRYSLEEGLDDFMEATGVKSIGDTASDLYHLATDSEEEFEKYMQGRLKAQMLELVSAPAPSVKFIMAYYAMAGLAAASNPMGAYLMPSVETLWGIYVKSKLGYYNYLYNLGKKSITQTDKQGKAQTVANPNYQKGGYARVFAHQVTNLINPMFLWGEVKGIFKGIGKWFVDLWEMIAWLGEGFVGAVQDTWNLVVNQETPAWLKTTMETAEKASAWLQKNIKLLGQFVGDIIRDPAQLSDLKSALRTGSENLAFTAGANVAQKQVTIMNMSAEDQGEMVGKAIGYIIPEIVLAILSDTIVNWIKWGVQALKATKVAGKLFEAARWVVEAFEKLVLVLKSSAKGKFAPLGDMFDDVLKYFKGLGKVENEIPKVKTTKPTVPETKPGVKKPNAETHEPKAGEGKGTTKEGEPKSGGISDLPADFAHVCTIGSLHCKQGIPAKVRKEVGDCPHADLVPEPKPPFELRGTTDKKYVELRTAEGTDARRRKILSQDRKQWPKKFRKLFEDAEKAAQKQGRKFRPLEEDWPKDWEVHHKKPVDFGGDNSVGNLMPIPKDVHSEITAWWRLVKKETGKYFTDAQWKRIVGGSRTEIFDPSMVPKR